jgi:WD40 repeat protein
MLFNSRGLRGIWLVSTICTFWLESHRSLQPTPPADHKPYTTDYYGDALPEGAIARIGTTRLRQPLGNWLEYSADGKFLHASTLSCGASGVIRQWDVNSGREVRAWHVPSPSSVIVAIKLGRNYVVVKAGPQLNLWDIETERIRFSVPGDFATAVISPSGKFLAAWDVNEKFIRVWAVQTGRQVIRLDCPFDKVQSAMSVEEIAISPDDRFIASNTSPPGTIQVWELSSGKEVLAQTESDLSSLTFSPDDKVLAWCTSHVLCLWDLVAMRELQRQEIGTHFGHPGVAFSPDRSQVACGTSSIRFFDLVTGKEGRRLQPNPPYVARTLAYSPDGKELAALGGVFGCAIRRWDLTCGKEFPPRGIHFDRVTQLAFGPDSRMIASRSAERTFSISDTATGKPLWYQPGNLLDYDCGLAVANDARTIATREGEESVVHIRDFATGRRLHAFRHEHHVVFFGFSADAQVLISVTADSKYHQWNLATGKETAPAFSLVNFLGSTTGRGYSRRTDGSLSEVPTELSLLSEEILFSKNGQLLAHVPGRSIQGDSPPLDLRPPKEEEGEDVVIINELITDQNPPAVRISFDGRHDIHILPQCRFSDDGRTLIFAFRRHWTRKPFMTLVEVATGKERARLAGSGANDFQGAIATHGRFVAVADAKSPGELPTLPQGPIRLWDAVTGSEVARFPQDAGVCCLLFSPDGKMLASGLADSIVLIWDLTHVKKKMSAESQQKSLTSQALEDLWRDLASDDARKAYLAIHSLASSPQAAVSVMEKGLRPAEPTDARQVEQAVNDLDSDSFAKRDQAERTLTKPWIRTAVALRQALRTNPSPEFRRRAEKLLGKAQSWHFTAEELQALRAVETLELIGTKEARRLLERVARGAPEVRLTQEAKASLARLAHRLD